MSLKRFFRRAQWDEERAREIESYLQIETDANIARGMPPQQARQAARKKFGNPTIIREEIYRMNTISFLETLWQDLRYAARGFRLNRAFTVLAVLTLGLGIGSVAVIYSVIDNVLLNPFPYRDSDRMVDVMVRDSARDSIVRGPLPTDEYLDFQDSGVFEDVAGTTVESMIYRSAEGKQSLNVAWVTSNVFDFLGVDALLGRTTSEEDGRIDAPPVAVMSHKTWLTHFSADPAVVGAVVRLDDQAYTVIGVMPPRFTWNVADFWVPRDLDRAHTSAESTRRWFQAHLKPGVSIEQAEAELNVIASRRAADDPTRYPKQFHIQVITVIDWVVGRFRGVLYTLLAAVGLLLLIACCNVANMLLARATAREREMTVRAAIGASRSRLIRQLLVESLLLSMCGAAAGCLIAYAGIAGVVQFMPQQNVPLETEISLDSRVLLFTLATAVLSALLFGLAPALHGVRRNLVAGLKDSGKGVSGGFRHGGVRNALVVAEIALSLILLTGAGLLMRSFISLVRTDPGFDPTNVLMTFIGFTEGTHASAEAKQAFLRDSLARIRALPGVISATETTAIPPFTGGSSPVEILGKPHSDEWRSQLQMCGDQYFDTLKVKIAAGRAFTAQDVTGARKVTVISRAFVERYFEGDNPVGKQIRFARLAEPPFSIQDPTFEIIGIAEDVRNQGLQEPPAPNAYLPSMLVNFPRWGILVRTSSPAASINAVRAEVRAADTEVIADVRSLEEILGARFYAQPRFSLLILTAFAATGIVLVAIGVYSVLAYTVSRQTQEIALRMALGANRGEVLKVVFRLGMRLAAVGIVPGLLASVATNQVIFSQVGYQLLNVSPYDPLTLTVAIAVITLMALAACYLPARRALRVDPMQALRHE